MARHKGELTAAGVDRGWPHQVALKADFVREHFQTIRAFCAGLSLCSRGHSVQHEGSGYVVYCFAKPDDAASFRARFDGEPFNPADRGRGANWFRWNKPR